MSKELLPIEKKNITLNKPNKSQKTKKDKLSNALRDNLRRRKAAMLPLSNEFEREE